MSPWSVHVNGNVTPGKRKRQGVAVAETTAVQFENEPESAKTNKFG